MRQDRNGLEVLEHGECLDLLRTASFGRVGLLVDGLPVVLPVNFRLDDDRVVVRTVRGSKLAAATRNAMVAFEVDESDPATGDGWSVMVRGIAREMANVEHARSSWNAAWLDDRDARFVTISLDVVSGRRLNLGRGASLDLSLNGTGP